MSSEQPGRDENGLLSATAHALPPLLRSHSIMVDKENVEDDEEFNQENEKNGEIEGEIIESSKPNEENGRANTGKGDMKDSDNAISETDTNEGKTETSAENNESEQVESASEHQEKLETDSTSENLEKADQEKGAFDSNDKTQQENKTDQKSEENEKLNETKEDSTEKTDKEKAKPAKTPEPHLKIESSISLKLRNKVKVRVSPIWTPKNKRANASLIYLYFRNVSLELD